MTLKRRPYPTFNLEYCFRLGVSADQFSELFSVVGEPGWTVGLFAPPPAVVSVGYAGLNCPEGAE